MNKLALLPNIITALRIALTLPLVIVLASGQYEIGLLLILAAGVSDALDGFLARRFGWETRLGGLLDPVADKLLLLAGYAVLSFKELVPDWLFLLIIGRDLVIVFGALMYQSLIGDVKAAPSYLSKFNTLCQILFLILVLGAHVQMVWVIPQAWVSAVMLLVAVTTTLSGLHYVARWSRFAWQHTHRES